MYQFGEFHSDDARLLQAADSSPTPSHGRPGRLTARELGSHMAFCILNIALCTSKCRGDSSGKSLGDTA